MSDNVVVPDALAVATSTSTTDYVNLAFTTLVRVKPSCCTVDNTTTLTFLNTNADILFNANVVIAKICWGGYHDWILGSNKGWWR